MMSLRDLVACHWSARRIQRYLDADPSAILPPQEITRLEAHLAVCERCSQLTAEHRALRRALESWSGAVTPDEASLTRLRSVVDELSRQDRS